MTRPAAVLAIAAITTAACGAAAAREESLEKVRLPPGFRIAHFARDVPGARSLALGANGTVFVGTQDAGVVYAVVDRDGDGSAESVRRLLTGLDTPNGVAFRDGALYVAEVSRVLRYDGIEAALDRPPAAKVAVSGLPADTHHGWKFIAFGPDGNLYVPVGAPCNVCRREDQRYASILRFRPDGTFLDVAAHGVRNTVGFDWHPQTNELWFTDNGRDRLGEDVPPDELNHAPRPGLHFGFPFCHGRGVPDPEFGHERACQEFAAPALALGPHVAALGMRFYRGSMFPAEYRGQVFIAEHGSWNRTRKIGYRVSLARMKDGRATAYETFAEGWLQGESAWGRPVDVLELRDGSLLVSDDHAGAIYRITWSGSRPKP